MTLIRRNHGTGHAYWVDGQKLPGVTTILGKTMNKDNLIKWAAEATTNYALDHWAELQPLPYSERMKRLNGARFEDRDAAARKGTLVHKFAERLVHNEELEYGEEPGQIPEALHGHVDSYVDFLDRTELREIGVELVVANRTVGYCGTIDLIADLPALRTYDGDTIPAGRWLLDIKTGRSGIFPEAALQLCAYSRAEVFNEDGEEVPLDSLHIEHCGGIHVRADGWDLRPLAHGEETWAYFRHLAWLYRREEELKRWVGAAVDPPPLRSSREEEVNA